MKHSSHSITAHLITSHLRMIGLLSAPLWTFTPGWVAAGPTGEQIIGGSGSIVRPNNQLTEIHQSSDRLAINWQQFDVNANEVVRFIQPSSQATALNRIFDSKQSLILGRVEANGRIFLINPRGIIFGKDATVNVAGLVASSLDIDPHNFINGNFAFTDNGGDGVIVNQGTIEAAVGGAVVLLGKVVINEGDIRAPQGSAHLVSAGGAVISFDDNEQLGIQITAEQQQKITAQSDAVRNSGTINAEGGYIALNGATTADLFTNAVNNEGVLVASSANHRGGVIELIGDDIRNTGTIAADGSSGGTIRLHADDLILAKGDATISATGSEGSGGNIELLADRVGIMDRTQINASGATRGGVVHVGGAFHGERQDAAPRNARRTVVDSGVSIYADATNNGNGGEVVLWSDDITYFGGKIFARGGANGGDGGNVEVSGKQSLDFRGFVDTRAARGEMGNLLLDPAIINIIDGSGGAQDAGIADGIILSGDAPSPYQISEQALEALTSNVTLTATQQINIANLSDDLLLFNPNGGTVTFNVTGTGASAVSFTMADVNDEIRVVNGNLAINVTNDINPAGIGSITAAGATTTLGKLTTTTAGNISVNTSSSCLTGGGSACTASADTLNSGAISAAGSVSIQGQSRATSSTGAGNTGLVTMSLGDIDAGTTVTISGTSNATSGPSSVSVGGVTIATGNINAGGNVSVTGNTNGSNTSGASTTLGNVGVTTGTITTGGTVTASATSTASAAAVGTANAGTATTTVGNITAANAVTLSATSNASNGLGTQTGDTATINAADVLVTANAALQMTAASSNSNAENIHIGGNYIDNGGNVTITSYTLTLDSNAVINTSGTITLNYTNLVTNGFTLTQGAITNIYVGDISGSAGAGELGFSQANINAFAGSGLVLSATNNIFLGNATITSPSATSVQLIADSDSSGVGDISIASGKVFDLNGRNLTASGVNASINGTLLNSGNGSEQITTTGGITLGSGAIMASGSGNISLNAGTSIAMASDATIASSSGQLSLTAANNIALGSLSTANATTSAVSVTSTGGAISNAGATTNIFAIAAGARANLHAAGGIASNLSINDLVLTNSASGTISLSNDRALQISSFANTPATAASVTTTGVGSDLTIAGNTSSGSNLTLTSSGAFTVNSGSTVNSNTGTLTINSTGDAAITGLTTTNNTASAVAITSGGAIIDNGNAANDITATQAGAVVTLQAANGIGAANALDTSIANLALTNSTSGAVNLTNNRTLQINSLTNTAATAASITTTGATSDFTVAGATGSGGALSLTSGRNLSIASNLSSASNLALNAGGTFVITDGLTINSNAGTLLINSTGNAAITGLTTTNNTSGAVSVISGGAITDNGSANSDINATGASAVVTLQAANGIGAANALDTSITNLTLTNSASGAVNVTNDRALQINSIANTPATALSITTTGAGSNMTVAGNIASGSNIALTSSGTFGVTDGFTVNSNTGTLSINATGDAAITGLITTNNTSSAVSVISGGAIIDNGNTANDIAATQTNAVVTLQAANGIGAANALDTSIANLALTNATSGAVNLTNNRSLQINSLTNTPATAVSITTTGGTSDLTVAGTTASGGALSLISGRNMNIAGNLSSAGNLAFTSSGTFDVTDGFTINSNAGTLAINSTGNAAITGLTTTNNTASAISVISGGAISDNGDTNADITATGANAVTTLQAANGIGAANALDTSITNLALTNSTSGAVNVTNNRTLQISSFSNNGNGNAALAVTGAGNNLNFAGTLQNNGGSATLAATGNIALQNIANVAALNTSSATINYAQSVSAASITSTGTATVVGDLTASGGNIDLQVVTLGAGAHAFSTTGGDINLGAVSGNSNLQLNSGGNITLTSASLGAGNFTANSTTSGVFTANGNISAASITLSQFSTANLLRLSASNALNVTAATVNLFDDLDSVDAMTLTGTTQLQNDILLSITGSNNLLQFNGNVIGNNHALTIAAANNTVCVACTTGASVSGLSALDIQSSVKSVLGAITVNGNATINADQEIYLNDDTTVTGNLALLADANNDAVGIAAQLTGKQLNVGGTLTVQPIALQTITTPELCAIPTGLPQMPSAPPIPPSTPPPAQPPIKDLSTGLINEEIKVALQESSKYNLAVNDAALHNSPQITYLNNNCSSDSSSKKNHKPCGVDASMLDFLGTFLIDNQIPQTGSAR